METNSHLSFLFRRFCRRTCRVHGYALERSTHFNSAARMPSFHQPDILSLLSPNRCHQPICQFSTGTNPASMDLSTKVDEIIRSPVGSLTDAEGWMHVVSVVRNCFLRNDLLDHACMFELLGRLVEELNVTPKDIETISQHDFHLLLKNATYQWRNHYICSLDKPSLPIKPSELLRRIRAWNERCDLRVGTDIYSMLLEAAASDAKDPKEGTIFADSLLDWMVREAQERQNFVVQPSTVCFGVVMNAWVASGRDEACDRVEAWLDRLHSLHDEGWPHLKPNVIVYNIFLHALANAKNVKRAEQVLQSMLEGNLHVDPDSTSFSTVLLAYTKQDTFEAIADAETLLDQMLKLYDSGMDSAKPNVVSFTIVMNGYARLGQAQEAERLLNKLMGLHEKTLDPDFKPDAAAFNTVMNAWSLAGQPDRANDILQQLIEQSIVKPDDRSFHAVLSGWAKVGNPDQAEALLSQMHQLYVDGAHRSSPTVLAYNIVLDCWAKSRRRDSWKRACDILSHMDKLYTAGDEEIRPNVVTWNTVFNCFRYCGPGEFHHAFKLLDDFFLATREGRVIGGPNLRTWNTILAGCLGNTKDDFRVRQICTLMKQNNCKPDIVTYNTIFSCYAKYARHNNKAIDGFENFLAAMHKEENLSPTMTTYLALVDAWVAFDLVHKAEQVLSDLCKDSSTSIDLRPDLEPFHRVLLAWSDLREPRRVESLVLFMEELHHRDKFEKLKPGVDTYNILLHAWSRSKNKEAGERADLVLREMRARGVAANLRSYNCTLDAWANSGDIIACSKIEKIILEMILMGKPELAPDEVSYKTWIKAILNGDEASKARRVNDLLKTMKIHNFVPSHSILDLLNNSSAEKEVSK